MPSCTGKFPAGSLAFFKEGDLRGVDFGSTGSGGRGVSAGAGVVDRAGLARGLAGLYICKVLFTISCTCAGMLAGPAFLSRFPMATLPGLHLPAS